MAGYGSDGGLTAWLQANGYDLAAGAPPLAVLRERASAYIDAVYGARFPGLPAEGIAQERAWPRTGASVWDVSVPTDAVPRAVIQATYEAAYREGLQPGLLSVVVVPATMAKRKKVGSIEVEYFEGQAGALSAATPLIGAVEGLLIGLLGCANPLPDVLVV